MQNELKSSSFLNSSNELLITLTSIRFAADETATSVHMRNELNGNKSGLWLIYKQENGKNTIKMNGVIRFLFIQLCVFLEK